MKKKRKRENISKTSPLYFQTKTLTDGIHRNNIGSIFSITANSIFFSSVMNICVFSEQEVTSKCPGVAHFPCCRVSNDSLFPRPGVWGSLWAQWRVSMVRGEWSQRMQAAGQRSRVYTWTRCHTTLREGRRGRVNNTKTLASNCTDNCAAAIIWLFLFDRFCYIIKPTEFIT